MGQIRNTHNIVTIKDPDRWYMKYTEKRKHYFPFHSSRWGDSVYLALNSDSKVIFDWILSQSLAHNKPSLSICLDTLSWLLGMSLDIVKDSLRELKDNDIIHLEYRVRKTTKGQLIEENRIEENRIEENCNSEPDGSFVFTDELFEKLYSSYPKKVGKKKGKEKLVKNIKTKELYDTVCHKIVEYKLFCDSTNRFYKDFSAWVNQECWNENWASEKPDIFDPFKDKLELEEYKQ